jgi:RNA polymerase sigma-70 factor, ECF subfamily
VPPSEPEQRAQGDPSEASPLESTAVLLARIRAGDEAARDRLLSRYLPALRRWAHGRLPAGARDLSETDDLVQNTLIRSLSHLEGFEARHEGAFLAYLRQILLNQVRDEIRRVARRPGQEALEEDLQGNAPSPLEETIGVDTLERYEAALLRLTPQQHEAVVMRIEMGFSNEEIAQAIGAPTANAARMLVVRGLLRLSEEMQDVGPHTE